MTIADMTADARPPKLAFWRTVGRAYAAPFTSFGSLLRVAWIWVLLLTPVLLVISWFMAPEAAERQSTTVQFELLSFNVQLELLSLLKQLVMLPVIASIAVGWHRLILTGEHPSGAYLRFDRPVWLYAAFLLAAELLVIAPYYVANLTAGALITAFRALPEPPSIAASAVGFFTTAPIMLACAVAFIALPFIIGRLSLVLPPTALGRTDISLGDAWRATRGNTWRLFWGPIVCLLLLVLPAVVLFALEGAGRTSATITMTALDLITILGGVIGVGFLSFAYQHFFEGRS